MMKMSQEYDALEDRVHAAIQASPFVPRHTLRFETEHGHVTLRGEVRTYFQKQMAQEAIRRLDGVSGIENCLEVSCC